MDNPFQHDLPFDPTYGYQLQDLLQVGHPPVPSDFAKFWQKTYQQTLTIDPSPTLTPIASTSSDMEVFEAEWTGLEGFRVGGWFVRPKAVKVTRGVVIGHGYGGRDAPDLSTPGEAAAMIQPCARGFHRSARSDLPGDGSRHVIHGIQSRDGYLHRFCVADLWSAASALLQLVPETAGKLDYCGASFGGGIGALALPWEKRFRRAFLDVPSFGNHPLRLTLPCCGSGESVRTCGLPHEQLLQVLQYFDSSIAASFTKIPVLVAAALFDPAVPPPGQFAVYNALAGEKSLFARRAAHFSAPGEAEEQARLNRQLEDWFRAG